MCDCSEFTVDGVLVTWFVSIESWSAAKMSVSVVGMGAQKFDGCL